MNPCRLLRKRPQWRNETREILGDGMEVVGLDREVPIGELVRTVGGAGAGQANGRDVRVDREERGDSGS